MAVNGMLLPFNSATKYLLGFFVLLTAALCVAFSFTGTEDYNLARQQIVLRKIGHEVLLQAGDSTSRVLPVKKINDNEYQLRFENQFTFQTDVLVKTINSALEKDRIPHDYIVNVLNCNNSDVIFGYAMSENQFDNIVPCKGRNQPVSCYIIDIKFEARGISPVQKGYLIGSIPFLAFIGLIFTRSFKPSRKLHEPAASVYKVGNIQFDVVKRQLIVGEEIIELTLKEHKLLLIFATSPNQIIERARLQKEIWEDEGVIVGRSLDVFISKLRKKLEVDPAVTLINIHGKGYKLEIAE